MTGADEAVNLAPMNHTAIAIETEDGIADGHFFRPEGDGPWPAILFYMDGVGIRPQLFEMADRLTRNAYAVLLPNLYYRAGPFAPLDITKIRSDPAEQERLNFLLRSTNPTLGMGDTAAFLDFLDRQSAVKGPKIGCIGYCMGGAFALTAAGTFPDRVAAAASIHGARLAIDTPESPHRFADRTQGKLYIAVAGTDPWLEPGETETLRAALVAADADYEIETFPGVEHGFAVAGSPVYDRDASERHWQKLLSLFRETL
jgi:carboxymethylenebutenolidase